MLKYVYAFLIAGLSVVIDQASKNYVVNKFAAMADANVNAVEVTRFFTLVLVHNRGISFGMFNGLEYSRYIFTFVAVAITGFLLHWMKTMTCRYMIVGVGLIVGGAMGNVVDRLRYGYVVDFLDFHLYDLHWPAFNIADSSVFVGVFLLCLGSFMEDKKKQQQKVILDTK